MTTLPTRAQVAAAAPLDFEHKPAEKLANISITVGPAGLSITAEYTGSLASIPQAVERLRAAGVLELVSAAKPAQAAPAARQQAKAAKVAPEYNADGDPCCPKHHKPLREGQYGLYCPAKDDTTERGYCALRFAE